MSYPNVPEAAARRARFWPGVLPGALLLGLSVAVWSGVGKLRAEARAHETQQTYREGSAALATDGAPQTVGTRISQSRVLPYPLSQVWPTAVRYLRVDRRYTIRERDEQAGFILFEFPISSSSPTGEGSVELFTTEDPSGRVSVRAQISTNRGPIHLPHTILDGLAAKLRAERGQPAPPPKKAPPDTPPPKQPAPPNDTQPKPQSG